jgi:hypothetical protein
MRIKPTSHLAAFYLALSPRAESITVRNGTWTPNAGIAVQDGDGLS